MRTSELWGCRQMMKMQTEDRTDRRTTKVIQRALPFPTCSPYTASTTHSRVNTTAEQKTEGCYLPVHYMNTNTIILHFPGLNFTATRCRKNKHKLDLEMLTYGASCSINNDARNLGGYVTDGLHQHPDGKPLLKGCCLQLLAVLIPAVHICHASFSLQLLQFHRLLVRTSGTKTARLVPADLKQQFNETFFKRSLLFLFIWSNIQ